MLIMPTTCGYVVDYETDKISRRTGKKIWHEDLCTTNKEKAESRMKELKKQGKNARMYEAIF